MNIETYEPNIIKYLPPIIQAIEDFKALCDSENIEFDLVWGAVKSVLHNQFINELELDGIKRWENILGTITTGTLDDRRTEIKAKLNQDGAFTMEKLRQQLDALCGENGYTCVMTFNTYTLTVRVALQSTSKYNSVQNLLYEVVPANLIVDLSLQYNTYNQLHSFTHSELDNYTYEDLRATVLGD